MVPGLLQWSTLVSTFFNVPPYHLLDVAETETNQSTLLRAKEQLTSTKRSLCPQNRLLVYLFTKIVVGTALVPDDLVRAWRSFPPLVTDIPVSNFRVDPHLTHAWYDSTLSANGRQGQDASQTTCEALTSNVSIQHQFCHPLHPPYSIIVVKVIPDWTIITSVLISTLCFAAIVSSAGELAKSSICFGAMALLSFFSLMYYISRKRGQWFHDEMDKTKVPDEDCRHPESRYPMHSPVADEPPQSTTKHNSRSGNGRTNSDRRLRTLHRAEYTVGLICALPIELATLKAMLDETHADLPALRFDDNNYTLGRMCAHNVVITCLPTGTYGPITAATVATRLLSSFQSTRFGLMIDIGGGVPALRHDIRLGDVVVGKPTKSSGGVYQCDADFEHTSTLNKPPFVLLNALSRLQANHILSGSRISELLETMLDKFPMMRERIIPTEADDLFIAQYKHSGPKGTCSRCDKRFLVARHCKQQNLKDPQIHYGLIASVTQVVRDGQLRDRLASQFGNLCFEMEAAGLMDNFPCLVIRGISDYADSHKNDNWQGYAASTAAAYAKELLPVIPPEEVENERMISQLPRL
ncbi:nucleoside phosphorylase domain-containing protein [Aspergillus oleicola]